MESLPPYFARENIAFCGSSVSELLSKFRCPVDFSENVRCSSKRHAQSQHRKLSAFRTSSKRRNGAGGGHFIWNARLEPRSRLQTCSDTARASADEATSETCLKRMGPLKRAPRLRLKSPLDAHVQWLPITSCAGRRQFELLLNLCSVVCCPGADVTRQSPRRSEPTRENRKWN